MGFGDTNLYAGKSYVQIAKAQKTSSVSGRGMLFGSDAPGSGGTARSMHNGYRSDTTVAIDHFITPRPMPSVSSGALAFNGESTPVNVWAFVINNLNDAFDGRIYRNGSIVAEENNVDEVAMRNDHGEPRLVGSYRSKDKYIGRISDTIVC